jgi:DNA repair exonuclease SbcCD ATPase subunit
MKLDFLRLENFLSYKEVELSLKDRGLVLLEGKNGSGKSSLFDGLLFNLYGITARGLRGDRVVKDGESWAKTYLKITDDNQTLEIERGRNLNQNLRVLLNGKEIGKGRDAQKDINLFIGFDYDIFTTIAIRNQQASKFIYLTDSYKKEILNKILNLSRFERAEERAKNETNKQKDKIKELQYKLQATRSNISEALFRIKNLEDYKTKWEEQRNRDIENFKNQLSQLKRPGGLEELKQQERSLIEELNKTDYKAIKAKIADLLDRRTEANNIVARVQEEIRSLKQQYREPVDIERYLKENSYCPRCGSSLLSDNTREHYRKEQERENAYINDANKELTDKINERQEYLNKQRDKVEALSRQLIDLDDEQVKFTEISMEQLPVIMRQINDITVQLERYTSLRFHYQKQIEQLSNTTWPAQEHYRSELHCLDSLQTKEAKQQGELEILDIEFPYTDFWVKGFSKKGIQSFLLDSSIPYLTDRANQYFSILTDGLGTIQFATTKELTSGNLSETLQTIASYQDGGSTNKSCISGGEGTRADISIILALGDLVALRHSSKLDFRLFDEPFEQLDNYGYQRVATLLRELILPEVGTIFVTTHQQELKGLFQNRLTVIKENGCSRIIEG